MYLLPRLLAAAWLVVLLISSANAASITYLFNTDSVTEQRNGVDATAEQHMFSSSDTIFAQFTYSDSGPVVSGYPYGTLYQNISDFFIDLNGFQHLDTVGYTFVSNDNWPFGVIDPVDAFGMHSNPTPFEPAGYPELADGFGEVFVLRDMRLFWGERFSGTDFLSDESLPSSLPVPGSGTGGVALSFATFDAGGSVIDEHVVIGIINTISVIPIPAAVWLFGSALAGLGWIRRKQTA
jgi:hypothetical protein